MRHGQSSHEFRLSLEIVAYLGSKISIFSKSLVLFLVDRHFHSRQLDLSQKSRKALLAACST
jgi:hypothetical protein